MDFSAVAKILIVFFGVLLSTRLRMPLGAGLIGGGLVLDLWAAKSVQALSADFWQALIRAELWLLAITITLIMEIGHFMASDENGKAILALARRYGGRHGLAVSLVGLVMLVLKGIRSEGMLPFVSYTVFGLSLVLLYAASTIYHYDFYLIFNFT